MFVNIRRRICAGEVNAFSPSRPNKASDRAVQNDSGERE
jgi:hypothetical protein